MLIEMGNEKTDKFGKTLKPRVKESPKRSISPRSRDRGSRNRRRSRSPLRRPRSPFDAISNRTDIDDPKLLKARVFIGKVPSTVVKDEIEQMFSKYGKILGCSVHDKGFAFVQFDKEEHAKESVKMEEGTLLKGANIDVRMAADGRKQAPRGRGRSPGPYDRDPGYPDREVPRPGAPRERSPLRDPYDRYRYTREGDPLLRRDDPYDDPYRRPLPLDDKDPYRRPPSIDDKDPYRRPPSIDDKDPYRRPLPLDDPYFDRFGRDDPYRYRRDPFADPYRNHYYRDYLPAVPEPAAPIKRTPADCQIIILNAALRRYAESVDRRLKNLNLIVEIVAISDDRTVTQMIEEASRKNVLFALVCNSQNEVHQSVTLNILHTTPQEHRNMPIDDAMSLVARSFETYLQSLREKSSVAAPATPAAPAAPSGEGAPFVPPSGDICYLLNLLADNRQLTAEEIDKVITYLTDRREKQFGRPSEPARAALDSRESQLFASGVDQRTGNSGAIQQQELQAKILSFLNGSGNAGTGANQPRLGSGMTGGLSGVNRAGLPTQQQSSSGMSALINFDNPSVQKALDNLIQSGPNLLKNISSTQGGLTGTSKSAPLIAGDARRSTLGYGVSSQLGPSVAGRPGGLGLMPRAPGPQSGMRRQF